MKLISLLAEIYPELYSEEEEKGWLDRQKSKILNDLAWQNFMSISWTIAMCIGIFSIMVLFFWGLLIIPAWAFIIRELKMSRHKYKLKYYGYSYKKLRIWEDENFSYETFIAHKPNHVYPLKISRRDRAYIYTKTEHMDRIKKLVKDSVTIRKEELENKEKTYINILKEKKKLKEKLIGVFRKEEKKETKETNEEKIEINEKYIVKLEEKIGKCEDKISNYDNAISELKIEIGEADIPIEKINELKSKIAKYKEKKEKKEIEFKQIVNEKNTLIDEIDIIKKEIIEEQKRVNNQIPTIEEDVNTETEENMEEIKENLTKIIYDEKDMLIKNLDPELIDEYNYEEILDLYDILFGSTYAYLIRIYYSDYITDKLIILISPYTISDTFYENEKSCLCEGFYFKHKRADASAIEMGTFYDIPMIYITECAGSMARLESIKKKREVFENELDEAKIGYVLRKLSDMYNELNSAKTQKEFLEKERNSVRSDLKLIKKRLESDEVDLQVKTIIKDQEMQKQEIIVNNKDITKYLKYGIFITLIILFYILFSYGVL